MVGKHLKLVWDDHPKEYLKRAIQHIKLDSPQNAEKVKSDIRAIAKEIPKHPERFPPDKYRLHNDGSYRVFQLHNFRISYFIGTSEIRIVRFRHSKQSPLYY